MEIWKVIPLGERNYYASSLGRIKNSKATTRKPAEYILSATIGSHGYLSCRLDLWGKRENYLLHRLVALAFIGPCPEGQEVLHEDGIKLNCAASNLRYGTRKENEADRVLHGTSNRGERCGSAKLMEEQVRQIRNELIAGASYSTLAKKYGVGSSTIQHISQRTTWRHI